MSRPKTYTGPATGRVYNLAGGERIDPVAEGIGCAGEASSPHAVLNGKEKFSRIFIRLRTPYETLTCRPIQDSADFARRASIIENWFRSIFRRGNFVLTFDATQLSDEEAAAMVQSAEKGGESWTI